VLLLCSDIHQESHYNPWVLRLLYAYHIDRIETVNLVGGEEVCAYYLRCTETEHSQCTAEEFFASK
jgi:hypothetical protein